MNVKKKAIQAKIDVVNSAAMKQAMAVFTQTGQYPNIGIPTANTVGAQALQAAIQGRAILTCGARRAPGNSTAPAWSCGRTHRKAFAAALHGQPSGTPACTWPRNDLEPGDLLFFFANISPTSACTSATG